MKEIILPLILFWVFYVLDLYKTRKGIAPDAHNEGNPIGRFLFQKTPRWLHNLINIVYAIVITVLLLKGGRIGLWLGYSAVVAHFGGFLSWTRLNKWQGITKKSYWVLPMMLLGVLVVGFLLTLLHEFVWVQQ